MESILYDSKRDMAYKFGLEILDFVPKDSTQSIIDIGSGSGALTKELTHYGGAVIGVDKDYRTIEKAKEKYPTVPFYTMDALRLQYENRFNIAFSNATFQEIYDKRTLLASIFKSLKPGGKLIAEFASKRCDTQFFDALNTAFKRYNLDPVKASFYHLIDKSECERLLLEAGFEVDYLVETKKKTFLRNEKDAIIGRIKATLARDIPSDVQDSIIADLMPARESLMNKKGWLKDVYRIKIVATKPLDD